MPDVYAVDHALDQTYPCLLIKEATPMNHGCKSLFTLAYALGERCRSMTVIDWTETGKSFHVGLL